MADYEPEDCAQWGDACWGASGHIGEYMKNPQLEVALKKGLKFFHYMDFDKGKLIPDENGQYKRFADTRELEQIGQRRFKTLTKLGEYNLVSERDFQDLNARAVKRCRSSGATNWILQYFDHGMGYKGMFYERHPAGGPISLQQWTSALGKALEGAPPKGDIGLMLTECSMQRMENIAAIARLKPKGGAVVRFVSGSEKIMWGSVSMVAHEWLTSTGEWRTVGDALAAQGNEYMDTTPAGTFSVIEATRFEAFYAALVRLLDALRPMGNKLKAMAKAAASNARAVFESRFKPEAFDLGVWIKNLQKHARGQAHKEFDDVLKAYRLMVYWVDKREISTGLAAEWTTKYAYRSIAKYVGIEKWAHFVRWCEFKAPSYGHAAKLSLHAEGVVAKKLHNGEVSFTATYTGPPGVTTAVLAGGLTKLQAEISFGSTGTTYVQAKWSNSTIITVQGVGIFVVQDHIPGMYSIPCWYKPVENRTHFEGELEARRAGLEIQVNQSNGHVLKAHLWAERDPVDARAGSQLAIEEVPPKAGGFVILATQAPQNISLIRGRLRAPLGSDWKGRLRNGFEAWLDSNQSWKDRLMEAASATQHTSEKASLVLPWDLKVLERLESKTVTGRPRVQVWLKGLDGRPVISEALWEVQSE